MSVRRGALLVLYVVIVASIASAAPEEGMGSPAARVEFEKGEKARKSGDIKAAAAAYQKAIEIDPDFVEAHSNYVFTSRLAELRYLAGEQAPPNETPDQRSAREMRQREAAEKVSQGLERRYEEWANQHPDHAVYQFMLGELKHYSDPHGAEQHYLAAVKIDPKFAHAYQALSLVEEVRGEEQKSIDYLRRAVDANPKEPAYLFYYARLLEHADPAQSVRLSLEVVDKFPDTERAAQSLYWLAHDASNEQDKLKYLLMAKSKLPPEKFAWSANAMSLLFTLYDRTDPHKAQALADEMSKLLPKEKAWPQYAAYERSMIEAEQLTAQNHPLAAAELLKKVTFGSQPPASKDTQSAVQIVLPAYADRRRYDVLLARTRDAAGDTSGAYSELLKVFATNPADDTQAELIALGGKLGKTSKQMNDDALLIRSADAKPATSFSLGSYTGEKPVALSDYKGKVILMNFWYPQCGPCRGEFPYIQKVLDRYKDRGFEIIAVNVHPPEDDYVLPILRGNKLGFTPARGNEEFAKQWGVRGEPTNFVIGPDGKVYFRPSFPVSTPEAQRMLELQIESLLQLHPQDMEAR